MPDTAGYFRVRRGPPSLPGAMSLYPIFADLTGRRVLVVGAGSVGARKIEALLAAGARVVVGAPRLGEHVAARVRDGSVTHLDGEFRPDWIDGAWLVIAATGDTRVNRAVAEAAEARGVFANVVDDAALCSFQVPAVIDRGPLVVAVSTGGTAPVLARLVRERLEALLDGSLATLATLASRWRERIRARLPNLGARRRFLEEIFTGDVAALARSARPDDAEQALAAALARADGSARGRVTLVGAGPGDAGLLTLAGLRALHEADVILHDSLVSDDVLALARRDADRIAVGKRGGGGHTPQEHIHALLLEHARAGRRVVRLKGGDPFVFGRGGEELEFLRDHDIDYAVIPGITAALACAAHAGIPLTHRDHAQSVRFVTAHCRESLDTLDWPALAQERQTLAVYMGVATLDVLRDRLLAHGRDAATPFALIENGTRHDQRVVTGTLATLVEAAQAHAVRSPALLVLGEVAALADRLHWFGTPPLQAPHVLPRALRAA